MFYRRQKPTLYSWYPIIEGVVTHGGNDTAQKATIHQVTTMLTTSKNVLYRGHNHPLTTGTDDPTLWLSPEHQRAFWTVWDMLLFAKETMALPAVFHNYDQALHIQMYHDDIYSDISTLAISGVDN